MGRFSFSKNERLSGKKNISRVLAKKGRRISSSDGTLYAKYVILPAETAGYTRAAVFISKRLGKAVWRNRLRRLIKEAYRLEKERLINHCEQVSMQLHIIFFPLVFSQTKTRIMHLNDIRPAMNSLIDQLCAV